MTKKCIFISRVDIKKFVKIGRPGYRVTKQRDPESGQQSLMFEIDYPEIAEGVVPRHRFMSAYEQKIEPPDRKWQYLLFAAEPYETISFKVPSREVDKSENKFWSLWNKETKEFFLQFAFKVSQNERRGGGGHGGGGGQNNHFRPPGMPPGLTPGGPGVGMVPPPPPAFAPVPPPPPNM